MPDGDEVFARLSLEGARFAGARLPVDALQELQRYRRLILAAARRAWSVENDGVEPPDDFDAQFDLTIVDVVEGSAVSVLERTSGPYSAFYDSGRDELERELAAALSDEALEASMNDAIWEGREQNDTSESTTPPREWVRDFPLASLDDFRDLGSSLLPAESLKFPTEDIGDVVVTPVLRERNILPIHQRVLRDASVPSTPKVRRSGVVKLRGVVRCRCWGG